MPKKVKEKIVKERTPKVKRERPAKKECSECKFILLFLLMAVVLISSNYLAEVEIEVAGCTVLASMFVYPLVYLFSTMITKEYGREKALTAVMLAALLQTGYYIGMNLVCVIEMDALAVTGSTVAFLTSQVAMVFLYHAISKDVNLTSRAALFVLYVFVILLDDLIFIGLFGGKLVDSFQMTYVISCSVKSIVALAIVYIQYLVEKELA